MKDVADGRRARTADGWVGKGWGKGRVNREVVVCCLGDCSRRAAWSYGNSVLLRLLAILAAVLL
jgi:hypothetical protein